MRFCLITSLKLCFVPAGGCGYPGIGSGVIASVSGTAVGDTVTGTGCSPGYILTENSTIICLANGRWSGRIECIREYRMTFMYRVCV